MGKRGRFRANVLRLEDVDPFGGFLSSDPSFHDHLILAEGDSWFSIGGFPPANILFGLRFRKLTMLVSCAEPGDTIVNMSKIVRNKKFKQALSKSGYPWDIILLSGGGNDLIDAAGKIIFKPAERTLSNPASSEEYVDKQALTDLLSKIQLGYRKLAALRDRASSPAKGKPMVTHTYDRITPRNEPARFMQYPLGGPWLYETFNKRRVPVEDWIALSTYLTDQLAATIIGLQTGPEAIDNFHVVDTRGTLTPPRLDDVGPTTHWLNEIHPNYDGYKELGRKIERETLYDILYGGF